MRRAPTHEALRWLRELGHDLGVLTGTDLRVLLAVDALWQVLPYFARGEHSTVVGAARAVLAAMQAKSRHLARDLIARALDWPDRDRLWPEGQALP